MARLRIRGPALVGAGPALRLAPDAVVSIQDGRVASVSLEGDEGHGTGPLLRLAPDEVLAPGFLDAHVHLKMQALDADLFRRRADDTTTRRIGRYDDALRSLPEDAVRAAVLEGARQELASGVTTCWTRSYFRGMASALAGRAPRLALGRNVRAGPDLDKRLQEALLPGLAYDLHAPFLPTLVMHEAGLPPDALRRMADFARAAPGGPLPVQAHVSQRAEERAELGESALERLERTGVLGLGSFVAVHATYCDATDFELLARHRVPVAYCPGAARRAGVPNPARALRGRVPLLLATDTPPFHMGQQLLLAVEDGGFTHAEAFAAATAAPAAALRIPAGSVEAGRLADLAVWSLGAPVAELDLEGVVARLARQDHAQATLVGGQALHAAPRFAPRLLPVGGAVA